MVGPAAIGPLLIEGTEHHQAGRLHQAAACYQQVLALAPENADALHLLGMVAHATGAKDEAIDLVQRAVNVDPGDLEFREHLAVVLRAAGRLEEAAEAYQGMLKRGPDDAAIYGQLAAVRRDMGDWDAAIAAMRQVVALRPDVAAAHTNLGSLLRSAGHHDEAIGVMIHAVELDPAVAGSWLNLGNVLIDTARYKEAETAYRNALQCDPELVPAIGGLGVALTALGATEEAIERLTDYRAREPADPLGASLRLAALGAIDPPARPSVAHMRETYARRAAGWDAKIGQLEHYPGLALIRGAIDMTLAGCSDLTILDAGCGTGLCGTVLRPYAAQLIGIDLSPEMLAVARPKGLYDHLEAVDLFDIFAANPGAYDVIVAGAVLIHIGDAGGFFTAAASALRPGGSLIATAFVSESDAVRVSKECVYWHPPEALMRQAEAAGLGFLNADRGVHEYSDAGPVEAIAAVWQRPAS